MNNNQQGVIRIELFEDFACPWCRIGRANLGLALERWSGRPVLVRHRAFVLDPKIPAGGNAFVPHLEQKFGSREEVDRVNAYVAETGRRSGLNFRFDLIQHAPNTVMAHRLAEMAPDDKRESLVTALFDHYFELGQNIGDLDVLAAIAEANAISPQVVEHLPVGDDGIDAVVDAMREAQQLGITGVPFFLLDGRLGMSGAQSPDTMLQVLQMAVDETRKATGMS